MYREPPSWSRQPVKVLPPRDAAVAARPQTQERTSTGREQEILRSLETASAAKDAQRVWGEKEIRGPTPVSYIYTCSVSGQTYRETLRSPRFWKMVLHDRIIQTDNYLGTYTLSVWGPRSPHQLPTQHSVSPSAPKPPATLITRLWLSVPPPLTHSFQCIPRFLLWQAMMCILGHALTLASKQITSPAEILLRVFSACFKIVLVETSYIISHLHLGRYGKEENTGNESLSIDPNLVLGSGIVSPGASFGVR